MILPLDSILSSSHPIPPPPPPPVSPYGVFHGTLFQYSSSPSLVAFESVSSLNQPNNNNKCILLGGLSDGLIPLPYTKLLEETCHSIGWSLIQPLFSSSYTGFGHGSIDQDGLELHMLLTYLIHHHQATNFALIGHSTGCQISIHFLNHEQEFATTTQHVRVVVLQAPVSDREYPMFQNLHSYQEHVHLAQDMIANHQGEEMMPRKVFWAPITASRYSSLHDVDGQEDFFSSDLTDAQLHERFKGVRTLGKQGRIKVLVALSEEDEYVPPTVDIQILLQRLCHAMNHDEEEENKEKIQSFHDMDAWTKLSNMDSYQKDTITARPLVLHHANHNLSKGDVSLFIEQVKQMLHLVTNPPS